MEAVANEIPVEQHVDDDVMQVEKDNHAQCKHDAVTVQPQVEDDLKKFCQQLVDHVQFKHDRRFRTGSSIELVGHQSALLGLSDYLDVDYMYISPNFYVLHKSLINARAAGDIVYFIDTGGVHPGYARLFDKHNHFLPQVTVDNWHEIKEHQTDHGPAKKLSKRSYEGTDVNQELVPYQDIVHAIHCPLWPLEASEWVKRSRQYGSPSKSVIRQVVRYGCDFVKVSHNRQYPDEREWRFSFSKAELIITRSWTEIQRAAYSTLHIINKIIVHKVGENITKLCTYYFKTLMLWASEERSAEFWSEESLFDSFLEILVIIQSLIVARRCPNYFIPDNNMMDHLSNCDLSADIEELHKIMHKFEELENIIQKCQNLEKISSHSIYHIELPKWIKRAIMIYNRIQCFQDNYTDIFMTLSNELLVDLKEEFSGIYSGLELQQKAANCISDSRKDILLFEAERNFLFATSLSTSSERCVLHTRNASIANNVIESWYVRCHPPLSEFGKRAVQINEFTDIIEHVSASTSEYIPPSNRRLLYGRFVSENQDEEWFIKDSHDGNNVLSCEVSIACRWSCRPDPVQPPITGVQFCKYQPRKSPTVNISWFLSKVYLANIYFMNERDTTSIAQICDEILTVYQMTYWNKDFAERTFPVIYSTNLAAVYDAELQELLGFYSLCTFLFNTGYRSRSVYMGFCLIQFALYLKLRCSLRRQDQHKNGKRLNPYKCAEEYNGHDLLGVCTGDSNVINGGGALSKALINSHIIFRMNK